MLHQAGNLSEGQRTSKITLPLQDLIFFFLSEKKGKAIIFIFIYLFLERGKGEKERERSQCVVASHIPPTGDLA